MLFFTLMADNSVYDCSSKFTSIGLLYCHLKYLFCLCDFCRLIRIYWNAFPLRLTWLLIGMDRTKINYGLLLVAMIFFHPLWWFVCFKTFCLLIWSQFYIDTLSFLFLVAYMIAELLLRQVFEVRIFLNCWLDRNSLHWLTIIVSAFSESAFLLLCQCTKFVRIRCSFLLL